VRNLGNRLHMGFLGDLDVRLRVFMLIVHGTPRIKDSANRCNRVLIANSNWTGAVSEPESQIVLRPGAAEA
jgi:hypothetical protein